MIERIRDLTPEEAAQEEGGDAARAFAAFLRDDQLETLVEHGPARLLDGLTPAQDVLLPESPYLTDLDEREDELRDEWNTAFWQTLEGMWDYRAPDPHLGLGVGEAQVDLEFTYIYDAHDLDDEMSDEDLTRMSGEDLYQWLVDGNAIEIGVNATVTRGPDPDGGWPEDPSDRQIAGSIGLL